jgi:hypothetical protein
MEESPFIMKVYPGGEFPGRERRGTVNLSGFGLPMFWGWAGRLGGEGRRRRVSDWEGGRGWGFSQRDLEEGRGRVLNFRLVAVWEMGRAAGLAEGALTGALEG